MCQIVIQYTPTFRQIPDIHMHHIDEVVQLFLNTGPRVQQYQRTGILQKKIKVIIKIKSSSEPRKRMQLYVCSSILMLFYYLAPPQNDYIMTS